MGGAFVVLATRSTFARMPTPPPTPGSWEFAFDTAGAFASVAGVWLGFYGTLVALSAVALSVVLAVREARLRREAQEELRAERASAEARERAREERDRLAAALAVVAWVEITRPADYEAWTPVEAVIKGRNYFDRPVFDLRVRERDGTVQQTRQVLTRAVLGPGEPFEAPHSATTDDGRIKVVIRFRDTTGQWWQRADADEPVPISGPDHKWDDDDLDQVWFGA